MVDVSSSNNPLDTCAEVCLRVTSCVKFFYNAKERLCRYATFYIDHVKMSEDISTPGLLMYAKNRTMASNFIFIQQFNFKRCFLNLKKYNRQQNFKVQKHRLVLILFR